jgi:hypothetical protein
MKLNTLLKQSPSGLYYGKRIIAKMLREAKIRLKNIDETPSFLVTITDLHGKECTIVDAGPLNTAEIGENDSLVYIEKLGGKYWVNIKDNGYLTHDIVFCTPISKL